MVVAGAVWIYVVRRRHGTLAREQGPLAAAQATA
jgi:hypothetical protein